MAVSAGSVKFGVQMGYEPTGYEVRKWALEKALEYHSFQVREGLTGSDYGFDPDTVVSTAEAFEVYLEGPETGEDGDVS